jgi:two-component system OmpR family response regulator/two-component system response regulator QseB
MAALWSALPSRVPQRAILPLASSRESAVRLLIVEDDRMIGESLQRALRLEGYAVDWVRDAAAAAGTLASERFDLVLLDLGLPPGPAAESAAFPADGLGVLRGLRARGDGTPVIVVTARDARGDRVAGLDAGADDYIVKPFELDELNARIRAVLRRHAGRAEPLIVHGAVTLDPASRRVTRDGVPVPLSGREFAVLEALLARPGAVLSRAQLEDRLYGWGEEIESNAVSVYIHQLRRKLGPDFIRNVRGVGYFVAADPAP